MEPNKPKTSVKDFFLNLGAIIALYTVVINLVNLSFTVINKAYPQITGNYYYGSTYSISFPVATLIIFFPIFVLLMWLLEREYAVEPEKKQFGIRKWLTYITLFISGLVFAGDLVTVIYYFIDGQELTTGFLLKVLVVCIVSVMVFLYYISDIRGKLTSSSRKTWLAISFIFILGLIVWGFSVLGSPRTQQLLKYDQQKVNDLMNIESQVNYYFQSKGALPKTLSDLTNYNYNSIPNDGQIGVPYEYHLLGQSAKEYELCAVFNKDSNEMINNYPTIRSYPLEQNSWKHPAGRYCFSRGVTVQPGVIQPKPLMY